MSAAAQTNFMTPAANNSYSLDGPVEMMGPDYTGNRMLQGFQNEVARLRF